MSEEQTLAVALSAKIRTEPGRKQKFHSKQLKTVLAYSKELFENDTFKRFKWSKIINMKIQSPSTTGKGKRFTMQQVSIEMTHQRALTINLKVFLCPIFETHELPLNVPRAIGILCGVRNKWAKNSWSFCFSIKTHDALVLNLTKKHGNSSYKFLCILLC